MLLKGKKIVLGVTGGIAVYKAVDLVSRLRKQGAEVQVAMTEGATHFVTATTFQALSGKPVYLDQWDARMPNAMAHIDLSRAADLIVVAPASADFLARIASGMADDLPLMRSATHFNPVDLVCGMKNSKGVRFDLRRYTDPSTGFISSKSSGGRDLRAQELPGLWNGAMAKWNTVFVDVPITTFSPVKVVQDLLRPQHQ